MTIVAIGEYTDYVRDQVGTYQGADLAIAASLTAAEKFANSYCQRNFTVATTASDRTYVPSGSDVQRIHDCTAIVSVTLNSATVASTLWQAEPVSLDWSGIDTPYEQIRLYYSIWYQTIPGKATLTVNANWGWLATADAVALAIKMLGKDYLQRRDATFGWAANGAQAGRNWAALDLLNPYRRAEAFGLA